MKTIEKLFRSINSSWLFLAIIIGMSNLTTPKANAQAISYSEIWVSPYGTNYSTITGTGTLDDPYCTPTADLFYTLFNSSVFSTNMVIHLLPGVFNIKANTSHGACITPLNGWKIRGSGVDVTILQVITNHPYSAHALSAIYLPDGAVANGVEVSDLTIDCNLQNQSQNLCIHAINLYGSDNIIDHCRAINWGSKVSGVECFIFSVSGSSSSHDTGGIIKNCIVEQSAAITHSCGTTAFACGGGDAAAYTDEGWSINGCTVRNISLNGANDYLHAYSLTGRGIQVYNNTAINLTNGCAFYHDTWNLQDIYIHDNAFLNVFWGICANFPNCTWTNVVIANNTITVQNNGAGIALDANATPTIFKAIRIENNVIKPQDIGGSCIPLDISPGAPAKMEISCNNNILEPGVSGFAVHSSSYDYTNITFLSFRNNHNLSGTPISLEDYPIWDYKLTKDYDEYVTFTPTNAGWWKICSCPNWDSPFSARADIWTTSRNNSIPLDVEFGLDFELSAYGGGILNQSYNDANNDWNLIPQVRLAKYSSVSEEGFEIYVASALIGTKINIRMSGMNRPPLYAYSGFPGPAPSTQTVDSANSVTINIGSGISTSGMISASGGNLNNVNVSGNGGGLTNISYKAVMGGLTTNVLILIPGVKTNTLYFTNGILITIH